MLLTHRKLLVEDLPDVAELVEPRLIGRRALGQNFANLQRSGSFSQRKKMKTPASEKGHF